MNKIDKQMDENKIKSSEGLNWFNLDNPALKGKIVVDGFKRLATSTFISSNIEVLKKHPSGVYIDFFTSSNVINIKAQLAGQAYMPHMSAVATIGFDLYYEDKNKWVFLSTTKVNAASYEVNLLKVAQAKKRKYRLYFPLYQELISASLGVNSDVEFVNKEQEKIIIYGTSITQGGCASRPGLAYPAILGRVVNYEVINLGFSGSAHMEEEIVHILNKQEYKYLILELEANNSQTIQAKLDKFLRNIKNKNIILISSFPRGLSLLDADIKKTQKSNFRYQKAYCLEHEIEFIDGVKALRQYGFDETVDGVHLNDLGFYGIAMKLKNVIKKKDQKND